METDSDLGAKTQQNEGNGGEIIRPSSWFKLRSPSLNTVRLRRIFDIFDKNKDGIISLDEITQALRLLGLEAEVSGLEPTIRSFIRPDQHGLTFDDFHALHQSLNDVFYPDQQEDNDDEQSHQEGNENESDLSEAFKVFDEDGDGFISARELQAVLEKLGLGEEGKEMERVEKMISSVDTNHDGVVDFVEFKDMMRNIVVPFPSA